MAEDIVHLRSMREMQMMRRAGLVVYQAHQIAASMVKPGVSTGAIDKAIEDFFKEQGAISLFKGFPNSPGKAPFPAVTCISVNEEVVHGIPGGRALKEGDVISIDTGAKLDGWCGDSAYTHAVGKIDPERQRLLDVTKGVLDLAIRLIPEKNRWSEVAREMATYVRDEGFSVVENFVGHGIGRQMHEKPQVPNYVSAQLKRTEDFRLEPGLVIAVEPMVNIGTKRVRGLSDHWTQVTQDGKASAHFEHTLAITEKGVWVLTSPPQPGEWPLQRVKTPAKAG